MPVSLDCLSGYGPGGGDRPPPGAGVGERLSGQVAAAVSRLRALDLTKPPGISEAISWAFAVNVFGARELDAPVADQTLSTVLKYPEDKDTVGQAWPRWSGVSTEILS